MPSVTVMVQNSRGVPPACCDALLDGLGLPLQRDVAGRGLVPAGRNAHEGLVDLLAREPHRVEVGAVRRARRAFRHMAAGQLGLEIGLGVHLTLWPSVRGAAQLLCFSRDPSDFGEAYGQIGAPTS